MEGGLIIMLLMLLLFNLVLFLSESSELGRRIWVFTDWNESSNLDNKIKNAIWTISKFQIKVIFIYCLIIGVKLIFSHGELLYGINRWYFLLLLITLLLSFYVLLKNLFVVSKKYTFLNYKEDFRTKDLTFFFFIVSLFVLIFLFVIAVFYDNDINILRHLTIECFGVDGFYEYFLSLIGLWLTCGLIFAESIIKSDLNTEPIVFELMSSPNDYLRSGGKIKMLVDHPKPQNNKSVIFKEGQRLNVLFFENATNIEESKTILITDIKEHDFIVMKIEDKHLPYFLRKQQYELKAELESIIDSKKLIISLWLDEKV